MDALLWVFALIGVVALVFFVTALLLQMDQTYALLALLIIAMTGALVYGQITNNKLLQQLEECHDRVGETEI